MLRHLLPYGRPPSAALSSLTVLITLLLTLVACKPPSDRAAAGNESSTLAVAIEVSSTPKIGEVPLVVAVSDSGEPLSGAKVSIVGDMTHAGMQPVLRDAIESSPGEYRADDFTFTMAGDWIISATVTTPDGRRVKAEIFTNVSSQ